MMQAHGVVGAGGEEAMVYEGGRLVVCLTYCVWDSVRYSRKVWCYNYQQQRASLPSFVLRAGTRELASVQRTAGMW
jgi:hypothetical protein